MVLILILSTSIYYIKNENQQKDSIINKSSKVLENKESLNMQVIYYFDSCGGWKDILTINANGSVEYEVKGVNDKEWKTRLLQLTDVEIKELKNLLNESEILKLNDSYYCNPNCGTDYSFIKLEFKTSQTIKKISTDDSTKLPDKLNKIIDYLRTLQNRFE